MKDIIRSFSEFDIHIADFISNYGNIIYIVLFLMVFMKTAFVVLTFIPGDAIVFVSGTLAAVGELNYALLAVLFFVATVLGDSQNFSIGTGIGRWRKSVWFSLLTNKQLEKTERFLEEYGRLAIFGARFVPLMRTSVPFITGFTQYKYIHFVTYNLMGGIVWVLFWLNAGFALGNLDWIQDNLALTLTIFSFIPIFVPATILIGYRIVRSTTKKTENRSLL